MTLYTSTFVSRLGRLGLFVDETGTLVRIDFLDADPPNTASSLPDCELIEDERRTKCVADQLGQYFSGGRRNFELSLAPRGTDFQKEVWAAHVDIPYGETRAYSDLAKAVEKVPSGVRQLEIVALHYL